MSNMLGNLFEIIRHGETKTGHLYRYTSGEKLKSALKKNSIYPGKWTHFVPGYGKLHGISFGLDSHTWNPGGTDTNSVLFVLDRARLNQKKILEIPGQEVYDYTLYSGLGVPHPYRYGSDELHAAEADIDKAEPTEAFYVGIIRELNKCLVEIVIPKYLHPATQQIVMGYARWFNIPVRVVENFRMNESTNPTTEWINAWIDPTGQIHSGENQHHNDLLQTVDPDVDENTVLFRGWVRTGIFRYGERTPQAHIDFDENASDPENLERGFNWLVREYKRRYGNVPDAIYTSSGPMSIPQFRQIVLDESVLAESYYEAYVDGHVRVRDHDGNPPRWVYRVMGQNEYDRAKQVGHFGSTGRIHASLEPEIRYGSDHTRPVLIRFDYNEQDGWRAKWGDKLYVVADQVPFERATMMKQLDEAKFIQSEQGHPVMINPTFLETVLIEAREYTWYSDVMDGSEQPVWELQSPNDLKHALKQSKYGELRGLVDDDLVIAWDAAREVHGGIIDWLEGEDEHLREYPDERPGETLMNRDWKGQIYLYPNGIAPAPKRQNDLSYLRSHPILKRIYHGKVPVVQALNETLLVEMTQDDAIRIFRSVGVDPVGMKSAELKKARNRLALDLHPDRGGDSEKLKLVNAAFDILVKEPVRAGTSRTRPSAPTTNWNDLRWIKHYFEQNRKPGAKEHTIWALDGNFFRGVFTIPITPDDFPMAAKVMADWNSTGGNPYRTEAIFVTKPSDPNGLSLIWYQGEQVDPPVRFEHDSFNLNPSNDQSFMRKLPDMLAQLNESVETASMAGCWITPDGEIIEVDHPNDKHHVEIIADNLSEREWDMITYAAGDDDIDDNHLRDMLLDYANDELGWIRISTFLYGTEGFIGIDVPDGASDRAKRVLVRWIKQRNFTPKTEFLLKHDGVSREFKRLSELIGVLSKI